MFADFGYEFRDSYFVVAVTHQKFQGLSCTAFLSSTTLGNHDFYFTTAVVFRVVEEQVYVA